MRYLREEDENVNLFGNARSVIVIHVGRHHNLYCLTVLYCVRINFKPDCNKL